MKMKCSIALVVSLIVVFTINNASASQKTKAQLTTTINSQLPSTGQGAITAAILRQVLQDMVDSDQQILLINSQTGTTYTFLAADQGKLVTFNNAAPVAVSLPGATGDFAGGWNAIAQNLGSGTVTVTPTIGTINGLSSLTLSSGQIALIVSGGLNTYRAVVYGVMVSVTCGAGLSGGTITTVGTCDISNTITAGGPTGSGSTVPVITYNSRGQLTAVTSATITAGSISAMPDPAGTGIAVKNTSTTAVTRFITSSGATLSVSNGDGISGNPDIGLPVVITAGGPTGSGTVTPVITYDARGRVTTVTTATIAPPFSAITGQATLAQLPTIANGSILSNVSGSGATPSANTFSQVADTITSARGTMMFRGASGWQGLGPCVSGQVAQFGGVGGDMSCGTVAGTGTVTSITQGAGLVFSTSPITTTGTISADIATSSNLEAGTTNKVLTSDIIYDGEKTIIFNATQPLDFSTFLNARLTLTANISSLTCSNIKASQSGTISFVQSGAGSFTVPAGWCSQFRWTGGTRGTLTTGSATAIDALFYSCVSTSICYVSLGKAQAN